MYGRIIFQYQLNKNNIWPTHFHNFPHKIRNAYIFASVIFKFLETLKKLQVTMQPFSEKMMCYHPFVAVIVPKYFGAKHEEQSPVEQLLRTFFLAIASL